MKIKILLLLLVIASATLFGVRIPDNAYSSNPDYSEQLSSFYKNNMWQLGKGLEVGQSYTYRICDPKAVVPASAQNYHYFVQGNNDHNQSLCYVVKLDFVNLLSSDEYDDDQANDDKIWVVQAEIRNLIPDTASTKRAIFHIDSGLFSVKSADSVIHPDNIRYGKSIENTLFSIRKYALQETKPLVIGKQWGEITEALGTKANPQMTVLNKIEDGFSVIKSQLDNNRNVQLQRNFSETYEVGYEIGIIGDTNAIFSKYLISSDLPFPLNATVYSPVYVNNPTKEYEFELLSYIGDDIIDTSDENNDTVDVNDTIIDDNDIVEGDTANDDNQDQKDVETSLTVTNDSVTTDDNIDENVVEKTNYNVSVEDNTNSDPSLLVIQTIVIIIGLILFGVGGIFFLKRFMKKKRSYDDINNTTTDAVKTIHFDDEVVIRIKKVNDNMNKDEF